MNAELLEILAREGNYFKVHVRLSTYWVVEIFADGHTVFGQSQSYDAAIRFALDILAAKKKRGQ